MGTVNVNSLMNKLTYVYNLIKGEKLLALAICETWLVERISSSYVELPGYKFFRKDVSGTIRKHGVGLYLDSSIQAVPVEVEVPNVLVVNVLCWELYLVVVYRPPSNMESDNGELLQFLADFCLDKHLLVFGDFNLPTLRWRSDQESDVGYVTPLDGSFAETFMEVGLNQLVHEPTFVSSGNVLDLVFSSDLEMVGDVSVLPPLPNCQHSPVVVEIYVPGVGDSLQVPDTEVRLWFKGNYDAINRELLLIDWEGLFEGLSPDSCYNIFLSFVDDLVDQYVPVTQNRVTSRRIADPPRSLLRDRSYAWEVFKRLRGSFGRRHSEVIIAWERYSCLNREYRGYSINKQWEHEENLVQNLSRVPKLFHSYIRRKKKGRPPVGPLKRNFAILTDPAEMSEVFAEYFASVFRIDGPGTVEEHQRSDAEMDPLRLTYDAVLDVLSRLDTSSAPGPDGVHPKLLRECAQALTFPLLLIFESSLCDGVLPEAWKGSVITPIFKAGSRCSVQNYRPVSLTSVCCKTLERLLVAHIMDYLEGNGLLAAEQFGFRRGRSTEDQLVIMYDKIARWVDQGYVIDVAYLDLSKAFDLVSHRLLLEKIRDLGFDRVIIGWIESFLCGRVMSVSVSGRLSSSKPVMSGVPQGSVLGPVLFLLYVNFITKDVECPWTAFADDFKVGVAYCRGSGDSMGEGRDKLQRDLSSIATVAKSWNLIFNPDKCVIIRFGERKLVREEVYFIEGKRLKFVETHKDLGIVVDSGLRFHGHVGSVVGKVGGIMGDLLRSTICRSKVFMVSLFVSHIRPIIDYGSCLWNVGYLQDVRRLESLQRRWTR